MRVLACALAPWRCCYGDNMFIITNNEEASVISRRTRRSLQEGVDWTLSAKLNLLFVETLARDCAYFASLLLAQFSESPNVAVWNCPFPPSI